MFTMDSRLLFFTLDAWLGYATAFRLSVCLSQAGTASKLGLPTTRVLLE